MLTIVIATKNRSEYLDRLLKYYEAVQSPYQIMIGDSSTEEYIGNNRALVKNYAHSLRITHYELPGEDVARCHQLLSQKITTPYCACVADGAFLVLSGLKKAVAFLENNNEYSMAQGLGLLFSIDNTGPYGNIQTLGEYMSMPGSLEQQSASQRLIDHINHYTVTMYCVYRLNVWQKIWVFSHRQMELNFSGELLPCALSVLYGKVKKLDCLYIIRHMHSKRTSLLSGLDWLVSPDWRDSYLVFNEALVGELMKLESLSQQEAQVIVKKAFLAFVWATIQQDYSGQYQHYGVKDTLKRQLKGIPGMKKLVDGFRANLNARNHLALSSLLRQTSKHYEDFMPIYKIITKSSSVSS